MSSEDAIEAIIGRFGKYQAFILILIGIGRLPTDYQLSNVVFLLPSVDYVCLDDGAYNLTNHCPCKNPKYDQTSIVSSVTTTWDLICERQQIANFAQSILHVGILGGSFLYGHISERYGRKVACLLALFSEVIFAAFSAASSDLWMFIIFRFLIGTGIGGTMLCCYAMIIELSGKSLRPYMAGIIELSYVTAYFTLPIIAYFLRDWRQLQLATSLPWLFVVFYVCFIPESPQWLIAIGQKERAIEILTLIAKKNNRQTTNIRGIVEKLMKETKSASTKQCNSYTDLFKIENIRAYTLIMALVFMGCSHTLFGVNQYIGKLQGSIYHNVMLSAISLLPGLVLVVLASLYLKRKVAIVTTFIITGAFLLVFLIIPSDMRALELTFIIIGQIAAYAAFIQVSLYASEVFPSVVKNTAMRFVLVFVRLGGFIAPFVVNIGIEWISITTFSVLAFCAGFLCYFLPETKDIVLLSNTDRIEKSISEGSS